MSVREKSRRTREKTARGPRHRRTQEPASCFALYSERAGNDCQDCDSDTVSEHEASDLSAPFEDDSADVVLSRVHREEGLLPAEAEKAVHQLLLLSARIAQMEGLSQGFEFWCRQEIQSLI